MKLKVFLTCFDLDYIPSGKAFFLRIFWDRARLDDGGPIEDEINKYDISDEDDFLLDYASKFIRNVEEIIAKNYPIKDFTKYHTFYYERAGKWENEEELPQVDYLITMTDPKWINHLRAGMSWGTTAYEI